MADEGITAEMVGGPHDGEIFNFPDQESTAAFVLEAGEPMADGTPRRFTTTFELAPKLTANGWRLHWPHEDQL